ncbi:hypothetical protein U9M48_023256, partial [Paspalum notatum var. saurae]
DPLSPMLFLLVMDVLNALVAKAAHENPLQPLVVHQSKHQISLYIDDVIMFLRPTQDDLLLITQLLDDFSCNYPGIPLTIQKPTKTDLLPLIDKIASKVEGFSLEPSWIACRGRQNVNGGNCMPCLLEKVQRLLQYDVLGIFNLETMGWALHIWWLWLQKTYSSRPWEGLPIQVPCNAQALFDVIVETKVWNGEDTKFWTDRWLHLCMIVRAKRQHTIAQALNNRRWVATSGGSHNP